jgi:hypothetical protein
VHSDEQQSALALQVLPAVLHDVFSAAHVPPEQLPLQHSPSAAQFVPSDTHVDALQEPLTQLTLQQSGPALHDAPPDRQAATVVQRLVVLSHVPEQQSLPLAHVVPAPWHPGAPPVPGALPVPGAPPLPAVPPDVPPATELSEPPAPASFEPPTPALPPFGPVAGESPELPHAVRKSSAAALTANKQAFPSE